MTYGSQLKQNMWAPGGLISDLWSYVIFSFLDPLFSLMDPWLLWKWYKRREIIRGDSYLPQQEANESFEGIRYAVSEKTSKFLKMMLLAMSVSCVYPPATLISSIICLFYYWVDKYYLLRICKTPDFCSSKFATQMMQYFDICMIFFTGSYFLVEFVMTENAHPISIGAVVLSLLLYLFNFHGLLVMVFKQSAQEDAKDLITYEEATNSFFKETYAFVNPVDNIRQCSKIYAHPYTVHMQHDLSQIGRLIV